MFYETSFILAWHGRCIVGLSSMDGYDFAA
jgi:hypothetical protein